MVPNFHPGSEILVFWNEKYISDSSKGVKKYQEGPCSGGQLDVTKMSTERPKKMV